MNVRNGLSEREGLAVGVLCVAQLALWTLAPALTHSAPPLDVVEMLAWGRAGVVATYKHPNLPGLVLETVRRMSFGELWPVYIVPQAFVAATFVAVYLLGRDLLGPRRALVGTLLLTGIFYFSWPTPEMNHNVAQMPLWAWVCLALRRATHGGRLAWWIALGTLAGIAVWGEIQLGLASRSGARMGGFSTGGRGSASPRWGRGLHSASPRLSFSPRCAF